MGIPRAQQWIYVLGNRTVEDLCNSSSKLNLYRLHNTISTVFEEPTDCYLYLETPGMGVCKKITYFDLEKHFKAELL